MLENKNIIIFAQERENLKALDRKCYRELKYEMDPFEWTLVKLPNGKTKAIVVEESAEHKDWGIDEKGLEVPKQVIVKRQAIIDSFEI
jgi:hypothetical protein